MNSRRLILAASVLLGVLSMFGIRALVMRNGQLQAESTVYRQVVIALADIPENGRITDDLITVIDLPEAFAHPRSISDPAQLSGSVADQRIMEGEQILQSRVLLQDELDMGKLSYRIPEDKRALSIPISESSAVSGHIKRGDSVDVLLPARKDHNAKPSGFSNVEVLWVGQAERSQSENTQAATIVLLVTPKQAAELVSAMKEGALTVALRSSVDTESHAGMLKGG